MKESPEVVAAISRLNESLDQAFIRLERLSNDQLHETPGPSRWSIAQILSHVRLSEELSLRYVRKKLSFDPVLPDAGLWTDIRSFLLDLFLRSPIKIKAAQGVRTENLATGIEWNAFKNRWHDQRSDLATYLLALDPKWAGKEIYKHPLVGRITIPQMLRFFQGHFDRHERQIQKVVIKVA